MSKIEPWLLRAVRMLPRYNNGRDDWKPTGRFVMTNHSLLPRNIMESLYKIMKGSLPDGKTPWDFCRHAWVDVTRGNVWVLHRRLKWKSLEYLTRRGWTWQRWPFQGDGTCKSRSVPVLIKYAGKVIVWNGTHRTTLCYLAGRKLRAKVVDLDAYVKASRRAHRK